MDARFRRFHCCRPRTGEAQPNALPRIAVKSPWKQSREVRKGFPALPLAERRVAFIGWIGDDLKYAVEWMRTWKDGGLLPYENAEDITHSCLDKIKADVKAFRAGLEKYKRLNVHPELEPSK